MNVLTLKNNLKIFSWIIIGLLILLVLRLAVVQLFYSEVYQTKAKDNRIRLVAIKAPRGEIYARDGEILAANELVYTVSLHNTDNNQKELSIGLLLDILNEFYSDIDEEYIDERIKLQQYRMFEPITIMRDIPWELVVKLEENRQHLPGVLISVEPLRNYPQYETAGHVLGYIHSINPNELDLLGREKYTINSLIGKSGIEKQYENELKGQDGARRVEVDARGRPIGELVTLEPEAGNNIFITIDLELQQVMENALQDTLSMLQSRNPKAKVGSAVLLNVKTGEVLAMASLPAMNPVNWRGNISQDLAEYYFPQGVQYNPLEPGAAMNRAIQVIYPPGSTFKPLTGMAALDTPALTNPLTDQVYCGGSYWLPPYIRCTGVHGNVNYYRAMAVSCNTYFQEMGRRAGKDALVKVGQEVGLGDRTGIDLPYESKGLLPTPEWKKEINATLIDRKYERLRENLVKKYEELKESAENEAELRKIEDQEINEKARLGAQYRIDYNFDTNWQAFDTFNMSIGQGSNDYSVIQLANYIATIANGGTLRKPYFLQKVVSVENSLILENKPQIIKKTDLGAETLAQTRRAMLEVTQAGGTAYHLFYHFPAEIQVGAKTGTSETGRVGDAYMKEFHGVFVAFAPFDDPEVAFAGVVEYGQTGGGSAGLVAKAVLEHYFGVINHLEQKQKIEYTPAVD